MTEFSQKVAEKLEWPKDYLPSPREANILRHYEEQIARGRESTLQALDRLAGDMRGQNRFPGKEQR